MTLVGILICYAKRGWLTKSNAYLTIGQQGDVSSYFSYLCPQETRLIFAFYRANMLDLRVLRC